MNCPQCGHAHDVAGKFCRSCGAPLAPLAAVAEPAPTHVGHEAEACLSCQASLKPGAKFCKQCGATQSVMDVASEPVAEVEIPAGALDMSASPVGAQAPRSPSAGISSGVPSDSRAGSRGALIVVAAIVVIAIIGAGVTWRLLR